MRVNYSRLVGRHPEWGAYLSRPLAGAFVLTLSLGITRLRWLIRLRT